jgi:hypothetical protein
METTMTLTEFLEYLRAHKATKELSASLADVLVLRRIVAPIPVEVDRPRKIAS